jgi:hypothetical protein
VVGGARTDRKLWLTFVGSVDNQFRRDFSDNIDNPIDPIEELTARGQFEFFFSFHSLT